MIMFPLKLYMFFFICSKLLCHCPNNPPPGIGYQVSGCSGAYPAGSPYLLQSAFNCCTPKRFIFLFVKTANCILKHGTLSSLLPLKALASQFSQSTHKVKKLLLSLCYESSE